MDDFTPYTYGEIKELYRHFAGQPNELVMLMDFTGLPYVDAKFLLKKLKENLRRKVS